MVAPLAPEFFVHKYIYDKNDVLKKVQTSINNTTFTTRAYYSYYLTGELKRVSLIDQVEDLDNIIGEGVTQGFQGLDYVYTLGGQLKSINHPSLEAGKDPGGDGLAGSSNAAVIPDVFGITLDYYNGDYLRTGRNITSSPTAGADYNGNIKAARWANKGISGEYNGTTANQKAYLYNYNRNNWLTGAIYGSASSGNASISSSPNGSYNEGNLVYDANGNIQTLQRTNAAGTMQDNLTYAYNTDSNQLNRVIDAAGSSTSVNDIGTQGAGNYTYDVIGQMTRNVQEDIDYTYNTQGLVTQVSKAGYPVVKFYYNERGQRNKKESYNTLSPYTLTSTDYYILDLSGNAMAIYNKPNNSSVIVQKDLPIFGLSRLGVYNRSSATSFYEITDHLGNVRAVVDKNAVIKSYADYYPFGEQLPSRILNSSPPYKYAFQGQELDTETNMEAFQLRLWDGRIGRWLSPDPMGQYASPYLGMGNNPVSMIDPDGGFTEGSGDPPGFFGRLFASIGNWFSLEPTMQGQPLQEIVVINNYHKPKAQKGGAMPLPTPNFPWKVIPGGGAAPAAAAMSATAAFTGVGVSLLMSGDTNPYRKRPDRDVLYRFMKADSDGSPMVGSKYGLLGARLIRDLGVENENDMVGGFYWSGPKGMSINRYPSAPSPGYTVYALHPKLLPPGLSYGWDGGDHGTVHPSGRMTAGQFNILLSTTKSLWMPLK